MKQILQPARMKYPTIENDNGALTEAFAFRLLRQAPPAYGRMGTILRRAERQGRG